MEVCLPILGGCVGPGLTNSCLEHDGSHGIRGRKLPHTVSAHTGARGKDLACLQCIADHDIFLGSNPIMNTLSTFYGTSKDCSKRSRWVVASMRVSYVTNPCLHAAGLEATRDSPPRLRAGAIQGLGGRCAATSDAPWLLKSSVIGVTAASAERSEREGHVCGPGGVPTAA